MLTKNIGGSTADAGTKYAALAVSGPFGAVKEQSSGFYANQMASRGYIVLAFDPSYTGESGGEPRYMNSPDINTEDFKTVQEGGTYKLAGGVVDPLPDDAPYFVKDYYAYYKTPRGYHEHSPNSNGGWTVQAGTSLMNTKLLAYSDEIRSAVMVLHGEKAHSRYFGEDAFKRLTGDNKELVIVPGASHTDLYDGGETNAIPFDKLADFFGKYLK